MDFVIFGVAICKRIVELKDIRLRSLKRWLQNYTGKSIFFKVDADIISFLF